MTSRPGWPTRLGRPLLAGAIEVTADRVVDRPPGRPRRSRTWPPPARSWPRCSPACAASTRPARSSRAVDLDVASTARRAARPRPSTPTCSRCCRPTRPRWTWPRRRASWPAAPASSRAERVRAARRASPSALGASIGATRVVTDRGWVGHERQIGTTGVVVDPRAVRRLRHQRRRAAHERARPARPHRQREHRPALPDDAAGRPGHRQPTPTPCSTSWRPAGRSAPTMRGQPVPDVDVDRRRRRAGRLDRGADPGPRRAQRRAARAGAVPRLQEHVRRRRLPAGPRRAHPAVVGGGADPALGDPPLDDGAAPTRRRSPSTTAPRPGARRPTTAPPPTGPTSTPGWPARPRPTGAVLVCSTTVTGLLRDGAAAWSACAPTGPTATSTRRRRDRLRRRQLVPGQGGRPLPRTSTRATTPRGEGDAGPAAGGHRRALRRARPTRASTSRSSAAPAASPAAASSTPTSTRVAVGVVLQLPALAAQRRRPEELIAGLKAHPAIAPLVEGGELKEYSAHLIPEGGYDMMPELAADGHARRRRRRRAVPGRRHLAGGRELRHRLGHGRRPRSPIDGAAPRATRRRAGLGRLPPARSRRTFVLAGPPQAARGRPQLVLSDRVQHAVPAAHGCDVVERMFRVDNPDAQAGPAPHRCARSAPGRASGCATWPRDAWTGA